MEYQYFIYCSCYTTFLYSVTCVHGNMPTLLQKVFSQFIQEEKKFIFTTREYTKTQCFGQLVGSDPAFSFKILEITERSLMIYIVPRQRRHCDTVRIHVEIIRKRCEEFRSKTLDIQIRHQIKPLPEVYHPVCEKSTGFSVFLSHFGTKLFMFSS